MSALQKEKEGPAGEGEAKDGSADQSCCTNSQEGEATQGAFGGSEQEFSSNGQRPPWFDIEVSMTNSAPETKTVSVTIGSFLEGVRQGKWKIPVERVRTKFSKEFDKAVEEGNPDPVATAKDAVRRLKKKLPGVCCSGTFFERANDSLVDHSGFLVPDLDNLGKRFDLIREKLKNDPHVQACFVSPTGSGLKVFLRIEASKESHLRSFLAAEKYFRDVYGVEIDEYCKDVSRLCFVGHDPDVFIREKEAVLLEPLPLPKRPGVSAEFLRERGVRHVEAGEAEGLLGYRPSGAGLWIAYPSLMSAGPLMVDGRQYGRLRLNEPTRGAKYLSPKNSGAQLYVPAMCGPFERELVICEGEFKALSLGEAGIRAVAIGGVSSAMTGGKLIADLEKLLSKFPAIRTVYFLGDADTALNFEFSREGVKLAGALANDCVLKLPRILLGHPNGIDDCRQALEREFPEFWEGLKAESVEVPVKTDASTIAAELLIRELPVIGKAADWKKKYRPRIVELAERLGPLALDEVAQAVKEHLGIGVGPFKEEVARARGAAAVFVPRDDKEAKVMAEWGAPYSQGPHGEVLINEKFFAASFASRYRVLFEVTEGRFYLYSEESGAWCHTNAAIIKKMISSDWHEFARREKLKELDRKGSSHCVSAICEHLKNHVATKGAFKPLYAMLHCGNGMLEITESGTKLLPFNPLYYSRNPIPVAWNPEAKCAEFMDVLLSSAMGAADVDLLVRWSGSVLLGGNLAQRFMMLEGTAGGGKGTFVEVLEAIIGEGNSVQMRTALLEARFEIGRFVDKTLLAGKDVAGDFLEEPGASVIKSLVGHDKLTGEIKGSMETPNIRGTFGVVITCNSRLRVRLDGDVEAWRRRMLLIRYERPKPEHRIAGYSKKLLEKEAEGILVLFVGGAMRHLGELRELGDFRITAKQQERVDALLLESDSLRHFVEGQIYAVEGGVLPSADLVGAYFEFCKKEDWSPLPAGRVFRALPDIMMELFGSNLGSHGQNEKGERLNGYPKVALRRPGYTRADIQP